MNKKPVKNIYLKEPSIMKENKTNKWEKNTPTKKNSEKADSVKIRQKLQKPIINMFRDRREDFTFMKKNKGL